MHSVAQCAAAVEAAAEAAAAKAAAAKAAAAKAAAAKAAAAKAAAAKAAAAKAAAAKAAAAKAAAAKAAGVQTLRGDWSRLVWSPLLNADERHLYYNVASFVWKGVQLEREVGSAAFGALLLELAVTSQAITVAAAYALAEIAPEFRCGTAGCSCM
eukprot:354004-Chlamydomonas_euryale.AAC.3